MGEISRRSWLFLILSGLATGASWLCYYRALQLGRASQVVPIDKLSVVITLVLAFVFLHEPFTAKSMVGCALIAAGTCLWCCKRVSSLQQQGPSRFCPGGPFVLVSGWYLLPELRGGGTWPAYPAPASARC